MRVVYLLLLFSLTQSVAAFDTTKIIFHFEGIELDSYAGRNLTALGDVNNDGFDDIAVSTIIPSGTYIFYGGNPSDTIPDLILPGHLGAGDPIDLDGDGINDLITHHHQDLPFKKGTFYYFKGFIDSISTIIYDSLGDDTNNYDLGDGGLIDGIKTGYINSDNYGDVLTYLHASTNGPTLLFYDGLFALDQSPDWAYHVSDYNYYLTGFGFIDFNGDGSLDVYAGMHANADTLGYVYIFLGLNFNNVPDKIIASPAEHDSINVFFYPEEVDNVGDINGDGWDDLGVRYHTQGFIYLCGPVVDTLYDYWLDGTCQEMSRAGDINGDGYNDLITGHSRTMDGVVDIFLYGIEFDTYYDASIYKSDLPPRLLDDIGYELSPAGDFNGDGYDDFMFSATNFTVIENWGDVFIVAGGPYLVTDVEEINIGELPEKYNLKQNYPNPFNPSTTIEFAVPSKEHVSLTIYNILGQVVTTLVDEELPAGSYKVDWDGTDQRGNKVASGVYTYKLTTSSVELSKKMVLVK